MLVPPRSQESRALKVAGALFAMLSFSITEAFGRSAVATGSNRDLIVAYAWGNCFLLFILVTQLWMNGFAVRSRETRIGLGLKIVGVNLLAAPAAYPSALGGSAAIALLERPANFAHSLVTSANPVGVVVVAGWYVLSVILCVVGVAMIRSGYRRDALVDSGRASIDRRPCVLYLRSFAHDDTSLMGTRLGQWRTWRFWRAWWPPTSFEQDLASVVSGIGPLVTVGRPEEELPQLGARRLYFQDDEWKERVTELMQSAALVVIRCGSSGNLWWEVEQARRIVPRSRLVVLSLGSDAERFSFEAGLELRLGRAGAFTSLPRVRVPLALRIAMLGRQTEFGRLIAFSEETLPVIESVQAGFNPLRLFQLYFQFTPYRGPLLSAFRKSFARRNIAWTAPAPNRSVALYLALQWGYFGSHYFYLRDRRKGWLALAFCCTCVPLLLSYVDALKMLLMTREQFARRYIVNWDSEAISQEGRVVSA